ncbi:MAG TPA: hypothetical protein H9881_01010 [Candidatus Stackebrandtia excrementipullorum]|nr:hypothetical protein [Candidatus Stackebrandtia excrementipullorum]
MKAHSRRRRSRAGMAGITAATVLTAAAVSWPALAESTADFQLGITHTERSIDAWGDTESIADAKTILAELGPLQNQHLMGWGAVNPWPDPLSDQREWDGLDARIKTIDDTGGTAVITLATAPGWMKPGGGRDDDDNGEDDMDWEMESPVAPEHFDDFAKLAAETAQRYDDVQYFQIWNEFKGFWNDDKNRWDYEGFTRFYNTVYDAVKEVRPDASVGGPYAPMVTYTNGAHPSDLGGEWGTVDQRALDAIQYWLDNKTGADFFTLSGTAHSSDGHWYPTRTDQVGDKFRSLTEWVADRTDLPIWWSSFHAELQPDDNGSTPEMIEAALTGMSDGGASTALWWQSECSTPESFPCLWTSVQQPGGGQPTDYTQLAYRYSG